ncbi:hypothetical protein TPHA_0E03680 [Tetrapisispora phaffii CBS 4417]|uniref:CAP-Gly domain-containing protein n=1 Tax=Tetrapisispora phaffii (strain ATCC 24235 / CBS 4417 / NBRC 1672 / NRRL Y-8282 / UCD 70-5) TaxID=1071381 RepID=G8BU79_TETPH|nr:hypothetical protein TPHA_0E03680 [Tetrapisispora phaffii CBS 4417]CCE63457.1 hypothetical protein TPHA_0E03680 [Tetrapisispora phaffii CBS 4417]
MSVNQIQKYQKKIGCFIQIPNVGRGKLKYVGVVDNKPGYYAGIDLLANIGKNNGSFQGKKYFETEYPQSGLFIQLQKVSHLIENASLSRRTTLVTDNNHSNTNVMSSGDRSSSVTSDGRINSTGSTIVRSIHNDITVDPTSPTPIGSYHGDSRRGTARLDDLDKMEIDTPVPASAGRRDVVTDKLIKEYEQKIEKQFNQLVQYKKLLDEQRVVLEEMKPTIDIYENNLVSSENEIASLKEQLNKEREENDKQKKYFENEHEQLLRVVDQLHDEIKENERRVIASKQNMKMSSGHTDETVLRELEELREYKQTNETNKLKWEKERDQLKMHNSSLNKEYQELYKDFSRMESIQRENETLRNKLSELETHTSTQPKTDASENPATQPDDIASLPIYRPAKEVDVTAGRDLWCALCDKQGHTSIDCPYLPVNENAEDDIMY